MKKDHHLIWGGKIIPKKQLTLSGKSINMDLMWGVLGRTSGVQTVRSGVEED